MPSTEENKVSVRGTGSKSTQEDLERKCTSHRKKKIASKDRSL